MTRLVALFAALAVAGCVTSKVTSKSYEGGKVTGGTVDVDPSAPAGEAAKQMDSVCGPGKWKVTKEDRVFLNQLGNIAPDYGIRTTFVCL
jgi:hypothetical protein